MTENPLQTWLDRKQLRAYEFATDNGLNVSQIYVLLRGYSKTRRVSPLATTLQAVEMATGGQVTMREYLHWLSSIPERRPE